MMSYEEEDTWMAYEEEDTWMAYEEEDTCRRHRLFVDVVQGRLAPG
jgi:ligand-binding SRPBCC domain-containing protein